MNSENQKIIICIFGACLIISLIGTILISIMGQGLEIVTIFIGIVTTIIGILATFLQGKNMTEKQSETLEKYYKDKAKESDITLGSISFETKEEMEDYLKSHSVEDMIKDADTLEIGGGDDVQ